MIKTNYHTHCYLCNHAQGLPIDYVEIAIKHNYQEIGISDHGPLLKRWVHRMDMKSFYNIYLKNIDLAISKYSDQIKIYKGLEIEYLEGYDQHYQTLLKDLDYLILGQHVIEYGGEIHDIFKNTEDDPIYIYKNAVIKAMKTKYFRILAHPDLYMFKYRTWNHHTEKVAREIIEAAIKYDVLLEINVNGIRRGEIRNQDNDKVYIYPRIEFWKIVKEYPKARIIIGEDNHAFKHVDDASCQKAREFAENLGFKPEPYLFGENYD